MKYLSLFLALLFSISVAPLAWGTTPPAPPKAKLEYATQDASAKNPFELTPEKPYISNEDLLSLFVFDEREYFFSFGAPCFALPPSSADDPALGVFDGEKVPAGGYKSGNFYPNCAGTIEIIITDFAGFHYTNLPLAYLTITGAVTLTFDHNIANLDVERSECRLGFPGEPVDAPTPTCEGYTFLGWSLTKDGDVIADIANYPLEQMDTTFYAVWAEDGVEPSPSPTVEPSPSATVEPSPSATVEPSPSATVEPSPSATPTPKPVKLTVIFKNGAKTVKTKQVVKGKTIGSLPKVSKKGYKFLGWYTKAKGGNLVKSVTPVKNVKLYAHWKRR